MPGARARRRRRQRDRRPARPRRPLVALRRSTGPSSRTSRGCRRPRSLLQGTDGAARLLPAAAGPPTCWSTTPTTPSPRRSRSSSSRPPATRRCWPSSRPSTARRATARSSRSLIRAAERGKQVVALVELKARFDEQANIAWARALEEAGVHVVYGLVGLKTHTKIVLVVRQEADGIRRYCHVGTGNYNPKTARLYEDLGLLAGRPRPRRRPHRALQLPHRLQPPGHVPQAARRARRTCATRSPSASSSRPSSARGGRIIMKMNSLVDPALIDALYDASQQGAEIDLIVRGICCLRPGVPGLSENIRVRSIVGPLPRALPDLPLRRRPRDRRVPHRLGRPHAPQPRPPGRGARAGRPTPSCRPGWPEILDVNLADDALAWELGADGTVDEGPDGRRASPPTARSQELAVGRAHGPDHVVVKHPSARERELKFTPGPSFRMPAFDDAHDGVRRRARRRPPAAGGLLRHRRPAAGPGRREPPLPQRRGLDGQAPGLGRRRAGPLRDPPRRRRRASRPTPPSTSCSALRAATRRSRWSRGSTPCATASCCTTPTASSSRRWSTTRCRCSTAPGSRRASVSSRSSSPTPPPPSSSSGRRPAARGRRRASPSRSRRSCGPSGRARSTRPTSSPRPTLDFASTPARGARAPRWRRSTPRLLANDPGVRIGDDPEDVHQARVATRRLRSDLRTFGTGRRPRRGTRSLRDELKWLGGLLGTVRDDDVLLERLEGRLADAAPGRPRRRASGCSTGCASTGPARAPSCSRPCARPRTLVLLDRLVAAARTIPSSGDARRPRPRARRPRRGSRGRSCATRSTTLGDDPPDEELHAVRIRAKRCRYAAEAVAPAVGKPAKRFAAAVAEVQEVLGRAPGRGGRRAVAARRTPPTAAAGSSARSSPASSPPVEDVAADESRAEWPDGLEAGASAARCASGCERAPRPCGPPAASSTGATRRRGRGPPRPPAAVRRLEPAQGQGRPRRDATRRPRCARSRRRPAYAACSGDARARPATGTRKGRDKVVHYWLMAAAGRRRCRRLRPERRGRRGAVVHGRRRDRRASRTRTTASCCSAPWSRQ